MVICINCKYFCKAKLRPTLNLGKADGSFKALEKWASSEDQRRAEEDRRVKDPRFRFDYEPLYSPWCRKYTPRDEELEQVRRDLMNGNSSWVDELRAKEKEVVVYPSTGEVLPVYVLCDRKNAKYDCKGFEPIREEAS